jgi:microcystin-dependent protein
MTLPFLSELRIFPYGLVPAGWTQCNGQLLSIDAYSDLFKLIGFTYGGDGFSTFAVPDLMGRVPVHRGNGINWATKGGERVHKLTLTEMPQHNHRAVASSRQPDSNTPANNFWASRTGYTPYGKEIQKKMSPGAMSVTGADVPHNNMAPYLPLNICICHKGETSTGTSDQFLGEIRIFTGTAKPKIFEPCDGQSTQVSQNTALFALISTVYGGDGIRNFSLPEMRGKAPLMAGEGQGLTPYSQGEDGGVSAVTLSLAQIPNHSHSANANPVGNIGAPENKIWANPATTRPAPNFYATDAGNPVLMNDKAISSEGGNAAHNNLMPYAAFLICIATEGFFPERG